MLKTNEVEEMEANEKTSVDEWRFGSVLMTFISLLAGAVLILCVVAIAMMACSIVLNNSIWIAG
ncbi:hypothetical protein [Dubosiella muris]|uniref:Uncharacterized protein n=2 Tax=Dubosiella TaxID=1937008 RepID=A0AC61R9C3_9FIRM|nr:hypothetical protein [Dubosiella muris]TGY66718.1 hypothetical protein E5336_02700 [Dubosiella muris]